MSWSNSFFDQLDSKAFKPIYQLHFLDVGNGIGTEFVINSGGQGPLKIGRSGIRIAGTKVIPSRWSVSFGGFQIDVVGNARELFTLVNKGSFAQLMCSINGCNPERIAIGQLQSITRQGFENRFTLVFRDLISAFQNTTFSTVGAVPTPTSTNPPQQRLFWKNGITTNLTSAWLLGDASMAVTNASYFGKETGANGIIKVHKSGSDPYYLEIASINTGANTFDTSPYSTQVYPSEILGYTLPTSAGGSFATTCSRLDGHPVNILGKILTSTGTGNNGPLDKYPIEWSVGGGFNNDIYDYSDADFQKEVIRGHAAASYSWRLVYDAPLENGLRDLVSKFASLGQWPVMRQGSISYRGCVDPEGRGMNYNPIVVDRLFDYDIIAIRSHEIYASTQQNTYIISNVGYTTTNPVAPPFLEINSLSEINGETKSLPTKREIARDGVFVYSPTMTRSDCATGDVNRMANWDHYTWERLTLTCRLQKAHLVAGDVIELTSRYLYGLNEGGGTFSSKRCMVIGSSFDITTQQCILELGIITGKR